MAAGDELKEQAGAPFMPCEDQGGPAVDPPHHRRERDGVTRQQCGLNTGMRDSEITKLR